MRSTQTEGTTRANDNASARTVIVDREPEPRPDDTHDERRASDGTVYAVRRMTASVTSDARRETSAVMRASNNTRSKCGEDHGDPPALSAHDARTLRVLIARKRNTQHNNERERT